MGNYWEQKQMRKWEDVKTGVRHGRKEDWSYFNWRGWANKGYWVHSWFAQEETWTKWESWTGWLSGDGGMPGPYHSFLISCLTRNVVGRELYCFQVDKSQVKGRGRQQEQENLNHWPWIAELGKKQIQEMVSGLFLKSEIPSMLSDKEKEWSNNIKRSW